MQAGQWEGRAGLGGGWRGVSEGQLGAGGPAPPQAGLQQKISEAKVLASELSLISEPSKLAACLAQHSILALLPSKDHLGRCGGSDHHCCCCTAGGGGAAAAAAVPSHCT